MSSGLILALQLDHSNIWHDRDISKPNSMTANEILAIGGFANGSEVNLNNAKLNSLDLRI